MTSRFGVDFYLIYLIDIGSLGPRKTNNDIVPRFFYCPKKETPMKENLPIGKLIRQELKEQERSIAWLAKKVFYTHSALCKILKRDHIDTALLSDISKVLKYDFFAHYSDTLKDTQ